MFKFPRAVLIEEGDGLAGYAPRLTTIEEERVQLVSWTEGGHVREVEIERVLVDGPDVFEFDDVDGRRWRMRRLTLELYERHVRPKTVGRPTFETEAGMLRVMERDW